MQKISWKLLVTIFCAIFLNSTSSNAADKSLFLVSDYGVNTVEVTQGESFDVSVKIDDASGIAGASFTVIYDTSNLTLSSVGSTFFDTFVNQNIPTPNNQGYVTVDSVTYSRPLVRNDIPRGTMLAAARKNNGSGSDVILFTLHFASSGNAGVYPISIVASTIYNTAAGYSASGDQIPLLVGIGANGTYTTPSVAANGCVARVNLPFIDTDGDGIDDNWEKANVPVGTSSVDALNVFSHSGDYDHDGYNDYQEYINSINGETDPDNGVYDPKEKNAPHGTGYSSPRRFVPAINLLLNKN